MEEGERDNTMISLRGLKLQLPSGGKENHMMIVTRKLQLSSLSTEGLKFTKARISPKRMTTHVTAREMQFISGLM